AEDGIRDRNVTGVQTCALPIFLSDFCAILHCLKTVSGQSYKIVYNYIIFLYSCVQPNYIIIILCTIQSYNRKIVLCTIEYLFIFQSSLWISLLSVFYCIYIIA